MDPGANCREIETYLCRRNAGHLIRIVGPAFERVRGWAEVGVPLQVFVRGIDRKLERYRAAGQTRRPLRIEYCEADVLDVFDEWRRAVGVTLIPDRPANEAGSAAPAHQESRRSPVKHRLVIVPRRASAFWTRAIAFSLPGITREEKITVSPASSSICG